MGLRCSLLGHDFGDVVVEHDRDERGEEVVVTERELRECRRCGTESVVSENTEVRRRRPDDGESGAERVDGADDIDGDATGAGTVTDDGVVGAEPAETASEPDPASLVEEAETSEATREQAEGDAIILDDETETMDSAPVADQPDEAADEPPPESTETTEGSEKAGRPEKTADTTDAPPATEADVDSPTASDDGADAPTSNEGPTDARSTSAERPAGTATETAESDPGNWPDESSDDPATAEPDRTEERWPHHPDPDHEGADDASSTPRREGERRTTDASSESGFEFSESPSESSDRGSGRREPSSGIVRTGSIDLTGPPDGSVDGVLVCPACGHSVPVARSSNRPGDICPECHAGYLAEDA
ncbi:MAG: hypothetical protein ABEJ44_00410 [Halanaeroarchaeum sp.]